MRSTSGACSPASYLQNPFNGQAVPLYLADYVLVTYGTGAIMAVPGEDQRDWDFAEAYGLPVIRTVQPPEGFDGKAYTGPGVAINSAGTTVTGDELDLNGLEMVEAKAKAIDWLTANGIGQHRVNYRLRDWLLSRQRFWGCPIPIVYCTSCPGIDGDGAVAVPDDQLPVIAPDDVEFLPDGGVAAQAPRGVPAHHLPRVRRRRRCARPTRWTPSSTRPGTSCASATRPTRTCRSRRRRSTTGCRSTSTSAASSTPSST